MVAAMIARLIEAWQRDAKLRFLIVGGWNTAVGWGLFFLLYAILGSYLNYLIIAVISHAIAVSNAFVCQRWLVFRSRLPWIGAFVRFNVTQLVNLACGLTLLALLVQIAHLSPVVAQCIALVVGLVLTYVMHKRYSFRIGPS